jgi:pyruvate,water dikinase
LDFTAWLGFALVVQHLALSAQAKKEAVMMRHDTLVVPLSDACDATAFGAKAATLARMIAAGYSVPPGHALHNDVYQSHLQRAGLLAATKDAKCVPASAAPLEIEKVSRNFAEQISATPFDASLEIILHTIATAADGLPLAVRSSAIGEDSAAHSFAGQLDSILGVHGAGELKEAVAKVWASLRSVRSLHYQLRRDVRLDSMGIILQAQVDARHAGVMFTRAPVEVAHGRTAIIIEYCNGLGERLVAGEADPARVLIDPRTSEIISHVDGEDEGSRLDDSDITALVNEGMRLEQDFGEPLDIEWAIDTSGKLWLLQARPITTNQKISHRVTWTNANIAENFPESVSPFLYSIVRRGYAAYFRNLGLGFGISYSRIAAMNDALEHIVGIHGGRLYYNLSNIHTVISLAPGGNWLTRAFNDFVGATQFPPPQKLPTQGRIERNLELLRVAAMTIWRYLHVESGLVRFEKTVDAFCARTRPAELEAMSSLVLLARLREFLVIRLQRWNDAALADTAAMVCYGLLQRQLRRWLPDASNENLHNNLLVGLPGLASHAPVEKLWELSRLIRSNPELADLYANSDSATIAQQLHEQTRFANFLVELQEYLERWGFRSSGELMLTRPSPEENPGQTLELLRSYATLESPSPQQQLKEQVAVRETATGEVARQLTPIALLRRMPFSRAWQFKLLLAATQGAIRLRERARQKQAKLYVRLRHIILAIGHRLVATGHLASADEIFYLECDEVDALLSGHAMFPYDVATRVRERRNEQTLLAAMSPPDNFELNWGDYLSQHASSKTVPDVAADSGNAQRMQGIGACGGRITASAAVLADASEAGRMQQGDIVVTRQTDPGWACVFFLARGLVIERGGMLSHGAIIARELGIPAVVGVRDATRRIAHGDRLFIDGNRGVVEILR